jgi:hypothetical protein
MKEVVENIDKSIDVVAQAIKDHKWTTVCIILLSAWVAYRKYNNKSVFPNV